MIKLAFSWRQKLAFIIAITLMGLAFVVGAAFMGLNQLTDSFDKQNKAVEYEQLSLSFTNKLLSLEFAAASLTKDNAESFTQATEHLVQQATSLQTHSKQLGQKGLTAIASQLLIDTEQYFTIRQQWITLKHTLGFTTVDGALAQLQQAATALEAVNFSMIDDEITTIIGSQKSYLVSRETSDENKIDTALKQLEATIIDMDWQTIDIGIAASAYRSAFQSIRSLVIEEQQYIEQLKPIFIRLNKQAEQQNIFLEEKIIHAVVKEAKQAKSSATSFISIVAIIVGIVLLLNLGNVARQLNIQLDRMQRVLKRVAGGDFSEHLAVGNNHNDEFNQLRTTSNQMIDGVSSAIAKVVDGSQSLLHVRDQLKTSVNQLTINSTEVEQQTEQSRSVTQQISTTVNDVAKRADHVGEAAQIASEATKTGGKVIADCVESMREIVDLIENTHTEVGHLSEASTKMVGIIGVINGLADQTNLLALNAAIEAARAGDAGRGFSVVADEVRALAQKTVGATANIGDIIKGFNHQSDRMGQLMEKGVKMASSGQENANNAVSAFSAIDESIEKVATEMDQVVMAVGEISKNTDGIAAKMEHIFHHTENTKETRLTLEKYADKLSRQAEALGKTSSQFTLSQ